MSKPADSRLGGLAPSTIKTRFNYVHMAFRAAVLDRVIPLDPTSNAVLPKARRAEAAMTIPAVDEVAKALEVAQDWFRPFIGVCAFAGLRLGEAAGLQLGDVDFLRRTISIRRQVQGSNRKNAEVVAPKYGSERVIYVPEALVQMVARHVQEVGVRGDEQWLFSSGGALLNRNMAGHHWRQTRLAAGLGEYTLHDLRHFFASALIADGCDVVTVQRALGHSSPTITLGVYAHLWPSAEDKTRTAAAGLMAAVLGNPADSGRTSVQ
ncbi:site-specific integrase [Paenarthrobacter sp. DKR-5]|nr:site-specific integrase [Paenarthrobacter sp. DKR-5]